MQSALLRLKLVNSGAGTAQFFIRRCGCDYRPSPCLFLQAAACRFPAPSSAASNLVRLLSPGHAFMSQRAGTGLRVCSSRYRSTHGYRRG
jgi:hypothetical protein